MVEGSLICEQKDTASLHGCHPIALGPRWKIRGLWILLAPAGTGSSTHTQQDLLGLEGA